MQSKQIYKAQHRSSELLHAVLFLSQFSPTSGAWTLVRDVNQYQFIIVYNNALQ